MSRLPSFVFCVLFVSLVFRQVTGSDCELKAKINRALRELPIVEEMKQHKSVRSPTYGARAPPSKRQGRESIPQLAKNIESFLQKVIPNHNLVQDLMGYITMPNPHANKNARH